MYLHFPLEFDRPVYLLLLGLLPPGWWFARGALTALGTWRGAVAFAFRAAVWTLVVLALAEMQWVRTDDRLAVVYLLDRSLSIPEADRRAMIEYANRSTAAERGDGDLVGAVAFGRRAEVELPPLDDDLRLPPALETVVDPQYTNLAEAFRLAEASFPADAAKRVVLLSDGNQNVENVYDVARRAAERGVGIDVVPVTYRARGEVWVEKVSLPSVARRGEPFDVQVLVNNTTEPTPAGAAAPDGAVAGTLELLRRRGDETTVLSRDRVELSPGKRPFAVRQTLDEPDFYVYEARFTPDDPRDDVQPQNNRALNFTQLAGSGRVLFIENFERPGLHRRLIDALRREKLSVTVMPSNRLFASAAELVPYDVVVLADVPRTGGENVDAVAAFTDEQIKLLTTNVREMGCGLVMLGGPNSFGAGGWAGTSLEAAMPIDFQVKNLEVVPSGALQLVLDKSGSMADEKLEMCKTAAVAAVRMLGPRDYVGIAAFDSQAHWVVPMHQLRSASDVVARIRRLGAGGGTYMETALREAYDAVRKVPAGVKHVIVLSDGQTAGSGYEQMAADARKQGVTTSCVSVGFDAAIPLLDAVAQAGGGKSYAVTNPRAIPKIFVNEARRVARPLIFEDDKGFVPQIVGAHEVLRSLQPPLAPLTGFVMTGTKGSSLVQTLLDDPRFRAEGSGTIAAVWTYGLGRTAVWTSDCGEAWATAWNERPDFEPLLSGLVRWTMRPPAGGDRFTLRADVDDGRGRLLLSGLDEQGEFLNLLDPQGSVVGPDLTPRPLRLEQTAPGRYAATFDADQVGSYFLVVRPGPGQPVLRTGVNVAYSAEFRDRTANETLLASLAGLKSDDGPAGMLAPPLGATSPTAAPPVDFFRHDLPHASGRRDLWPELTLAAVGLLVGDVFVRRVAFEWSWLVAPFAAVWARLRRNRGRIVTPEYMERLRERKATVVREVVQKSGRGGERESGSAGEPPVAAPPKVEMPPPVPPSPPKSNTDNDYTARLLRAKRKMWSDRDGDESKRNEGKQP